MQDSKQRKIITNRDLYYTSPGAYSMILFGLPFIGLSSLLIYRYFADSVNPPPFFLGVVLGFLFAFAGIYCVILGIKGLYRIFRVKIYKRKGKKVWEQDYIWKREGISDNYLNILIFRTVAFIAASMLIGPIAYLTFSDGRDEDVWVKVVVFTVGLVPLIFLIRAVIAAIKFGKFGSSYLKYYHFPFFLGETLGVELNNSAVLSRITNFSVTLRYVEEFRVRSKNSNSIASEEVYSVSKQLMACNNRLIIDFHIPSNGHPTQIFTSNTACYWEIVIQAADEGLDYGTFFLVPVYRNTDLI